MVKANQEGRELTAKGEHRLIPLEHTAKLKETAMSEEEKSPENESPKRVNRREFIKFAAVATGAAGLAACAPSLTSTPSAVPPSTAAAAATTAPTAGVATATAGKPVSLKLWWWGEEEAPGIGKWLESTAAKYKESHPNITVETVQQSGDQLVPAFEAAAAAKQGPDIAFVWCGGLGMPYVWKDYISPLNDYIDPKILAMDANVLGTTYQDKKYFLTWYWMADTVAYNKELFSKAGLDPENPPEKWDDFIAACDKLKKSGVDPMVMGFKDDWDTAILYMYMIQQNCDSPAEVVDGCLGKVSFTDPKFLEMWQRLDELTKKGYFNKDIMSLETFSADEPFVMGKAAIRVRAAQQNILDFASKMGVDKVGAMNFPVFGKGKMATVKGVGAWWPETFCIPSFAAHPQEAGDFLSYFYNADVANGIFTSAGVLPGALSLFDKSLIKNAAVRKVIDRGPYLHMELITPQTVDYDGMYKSVDAVVGGGKTPMQSAQLVDGVVSRWKSQDPSGYADFTKWAADIAKLAAFS
jgi:raffinose/stachyose/melibiose transport system substrate-binding protein